jgi:nucleoside-diphosphate-sugar epimerase
MRNNQIILGSGGAISSYLAMELKKYTPTIYLYSRNPKKVNEDDTLIQGDLLDVTITEKALANMDVAYLVAGVPYKDELWERHWPLIVVNVVKACKENKVSLVFFDNAYAYDPDYSNNLTEETPIKPASRKGKVRADIDAFLKNEMEKNEINIQIVRSADFYGVGATQSLLNQAVIEKILKGEKADWFIDANKKHSFTLVEDAAKATALLGNTQKAYNQVWHLPTDKAYTLNELMQKISLYTDKKPRARITPKFMVGVLGLFIPMIKETKELLYQFDSDYVFNSKKFETTFDIKPTSIDEGLKQFILSK